MLLCNYPTWARYWVPVFLRVPSSSGLAPQFSETRRDVGHGGHNERMCPTNLLDSLPGVSPKLYESPHQVPPNSWFGLVAWGFEPWFWSRVSGKPRLDPPNHRAPKHQLRGSGQGMARKNWGLSMMAKWLPVVFNQPFKTNQKGVPSEKDEPPVRDTPQVDGEFNSASNSLLQGVTRLFEFVLVQLSDDSGIPE